MRKNYEQCVRCIMDSHVDKELKLDSNGVCNHCLRYDRLKKARMSATGDELSALNKVVDKIKNSGKGKDYDCIIGLSGGVDSSYVAYLIQELGLRALAVHVDNGWNAPIANKNIDSILEKLNIDFVKYNIGNEEFKGLQLAFLRASVPDGDVPTDHAISALLWKEAEQRKIKYIISGMNFATESISVPSWSYGHSDYNYISSVYEAETSRKLEEYPHFGLMRLLYLNGVKGIKTVSILNYINYNKEEAISILKDKMGWESYGGKHHESLYTRFYQGYVLPKKFAIDKRYGHYSDLINAGQITRSQALEEVALPVYDESLMKSDFQMICDRLFLKNQDLEEIMSAEPNSFKSYKNNYKYVQFLRGSVNFLRACGVYPK